jgi:YYY domain-containing protein
MWDFLKWFVVIELIGWVIFPTAYTLFGGLKDRGFTVSKILGLLIWGYFYWVANIFGLASNSTSSAILIILVISLGSFLIHRGRFQEIFAFIRSNRVILIFYETVFLLAFAFWAGIRSLSPEIIGTEKPMELAFINAVIRSPAFPPSDSWLSTYAISYYYFGFLLVALFMHVCGTVSGVAFNLTISLWFALISVSSAGLLFNLIQPREEYGNRSNRRLLIFLSFTLLAPLMILIVSNAEGFLELLHARGIFWNIHPGGTVVDTGFWQWLDIQELKQPPSPPFSWQPQRIGGTWWWRASRVLQDYDVMGNPREIIDEFPFFSFHLADLHPHVISIPFSIMVLFWALNFFRSKFNNLYSRISLKDMETWITGFLCGSLIFINTWDFPIYAGLFVIVFGVRTFIKRENQKIPLKEIINFGISLGITSVALYLPFILGLSSQAGGFLPSMVFRTRGIHFLVMFFPQIIFVTWLLLENARETGFPTILRFFFFSIIAGISLFLLSILYAFVFSKIPEMVLSAGSFLGIETSGLAIHWQSRVQEFLGIFGSQDANQLIAVSIQRLISDPTVILLLCSWLALSLGYVFWVKKFKGFDEPAVEGSEVKTLVVVMVMIGLLLSLAPEFFYLRDQFGWRMNTIFKFYYQAWILLSLASSFFIVKKFMDIKTTANRVFFSVTVIIVLGISIVYPFFALKDRISSLSNKAISLDGNAYLEYFYPEEYQAVTFLKEVPYGVISEAVGGSYSNFGRISRLTGLPTVLGWPGHEVQWRGGAEEIGSRESDIYTLYTTTEWDEAQRIIDQYEINYIYIGPLERSTYAVVEDKFFNHLSLVFENSEIRIYSTNR